MKIIKKIVTILIILIVFFSNVIYAKYTYILETNTISLTRDIVPIDYSIEYSNTEWTNENVIVSIKSNKKLEKIEGFNLSEDGKILTKTLENNETANVILEDMYGNKKEILYNVTNIDKIKPEILGISNGEVYNSDMRIEYKDNIGIKEIFVDKYSSLSIRVHDHYYDTERYYGVDVVDTKITVEVESHPKGTKKYKYFLNDILYGISENTSYTF